MLGTSARIGEVLALRRRDIDIAGAPPSIRIAGTIVAHRGEPVQRQDHPKTAKFRRAVATAINESAGIELAAELLGHTDPRITIQRYVRRNEMVNPATADLLERAFARNGTSAGQGS